MCVAVPALVFYVLHLSAVSWALSNFVVIFSSALMMWVFRLVPEYVPAVFMILSNVLLGIAPEHVLLSGFASDSFFLALSVFGLGLVVVKSNVFYRLALMLLHHLPQRTFLLQMALFLIGAMLTPVLTAQSSRVALMAPLLEDIRRSAQLKSKGALANSLACCAFHGSILLSAIFLTGKSSNIVLYGMLSKQVQWQFSWGYWLLAASVPGILMMGLFFVVLRTQLRVPQYMTFDKGRIIQELRGLGPVRLEEWGSILSILAIMLGLATSSYHHIGAAWLCFAVFFVLLMSGLLEKEDFKSGIHWPFLFYLGAIIGIMRCVQVVGLDEWLALSFRWLSDSADVSPILFIFFIYVIGWVGGLVFGTAAAPALLFTVLLPMAEQAAVNSWLLAFVLLMATEAWVLPYQSSYFLYFEDWVEKTPHYDLKYVLKVNALFSVLRLGAIALSIPFWRAMEIL